MTEFFVVVSSLPGRRRIWHTEIDPLLGQQIDPDTSAYVIAHTQEIKCWGKWPTNARGTNAASFNAFELKYTQTKPEVILNLMAKPDESPVIFQTTTSRNTAVSHSHSDDSLRQRMCEVTSGVFRNSASDKSRPSMECEICSGLQTGYCLGTAHSQMELSQWNARFGVAFRWYWYGNQRWCSRGLLCPRLEVSKPELAAYSLHKTDLNVSKAANIDYQLQKKWRVFSWELVMYTKT